MTFPLHTVLKNKLAQVPPGTRVRIEYLGMATNKKGTEYHDFDVYVDQK